MTVVVSEGVDLPALQAISVPVINCSPKAQMLMAFASNFVFGHALPVEFGVTIDGRAHVAYGVLYTIDSTNSTRLGVGGRLSLIGVEALTDRNNTVDFNADLALDCNGELRGTGELKYYPPITSLRSNLP